jgi:ArsR family transcriptional regulator
VVLLSQALHHAEHPESAIAAAHRILRPNGRILILDLLEHDFGQARELYGDRWLGFSQNKLHEWLEAVKFFKIEVNEPPYFQTVLATAVK